MNTSAITGKEIHLAARPRGEPSPSDFALIDAAVPALAQGQLLVRNQWFSIDPYMRGRMDDVESYISPFQLGAPLEGHAIGEVAQSADRSIPVGTTVVHFLGWREYSVVNAAEATVVDVDGIAPQAYLGVLGMPGLTAYLAVTDTAPVRPGDVVFVSSAGGAVGSVAGQLARRLGASRVIGSAGGPAKAARLVDDLGFDAAIDYRAGSIAEQMSSVAPNGIDVYIDMVGSDHLEAAVGSLRVGGRAALVGAIGEYNTTELPPGPRNLYEVVKKRLTLRGILVTDHYDRFPEYIERARAWIADGSLRVDETVVEGIEQAPQALIDLLRGANFGKMLVRIP